MNAYPLISCICIANGKPAFFDKALTCFEKQNYPNRELVVAYYKKDYHTQAIIEQSVKENDSKIISVTYCDKDTQDDIIKNTILKSTGFYLCNWSEESWHHESRLSYQYNSMQIVGERFQASILSRIWIHDYQNSQSYLSSSSLWPETFLCRKEFVLTNWHKDEELSLTQIIDLLSDKKMLYSIEKMPSLYIKAHHNEDITSSLDDTVNQKILALLS